MNSILKKVNNLKMFKNVKTYEDDAAPSRPRKEPSARDRVSSSSSSSDEEQEDIPVNQSKENTKTQEDDKQDFDKKKQSHRASGGNTYSQNITIHVSNATGTQIGHQYYLNVNSKSSGADFKASKNSENDESHETFEPPTPPPEIEKVFSNRDEAQNQHFIAIKYDIRDGCRKIAEKLGLDKATVEKTFRKYNDKGVSEVFFQLMVQWKQCQPRSTTTVGMLCEALWSSNETIAAKVLAKTIGTN